MQTNTSKTKLLFSFFIAVLLGPLISSSVAWAGSLSGDLSTFTLSEDTAASNHETQFTLTLTPEPTDQVTTTFATNGQCLVGYNFTDYATGGAIVTKNGSLPIGVRALDDDVGEGDHVCNITFSSVSLYDTQYSSAAKMEYAVQIIDNDIIRNYSYSFSTLTSSRLQEGDSFVEQYQISVAEPPEYDILVTAVADEQCDLLIGVPETRTKTAEARFAAGSSEPVRFSLIPAQDGDYEGIHQCSVLHATNTEDRNYEDVSLSSYSATILDDEVNPNIPDEREYEGGLLYYKDANYDGIDDDGQPNVLSFINSNTGARQGLVLTDEFGALDETCRFVGGAKSVAYADSSTSLISLLGQLEVGVGCEGDDPDIHLVWILDSYIERADEWTLYDASTAGALDALDFDAIIYNLGDDFTTALVVELERDGPLSLVQANPRFIEEPTDVEQSLAATISNDRLNPIAVVSGVVALSTLAWLVWRKYFSNVQTVASAYPRVDRF